MSFTKILSPGIDTTSSYTIQELNSTGIATASTFVGPNGLDVNIGVDGGNFIVGGASTTVIVNGDVNTTGTISASTFIGDGSGITGVTASGTGIAIKDNSITVGVAGTIDFGTNLNVSPAAAGIVTVTVGDSDFAINDKIVHTGDTDTSIRFPAADTFTIETAGSERVRVDSSGNIGIGIDSPAYNLDLGESPSTIRLVSENNGTAIRIGAGGNGSTDVTLLRVDGGSGQHDGESDSSAYGFSVRYMGTRNGNNNSLSIFGDDVTAGTQVEAITINQDGSTGIGTDNPTATLDVNGTLNVSGASTFQDNVDLGDNDRLRLGDSNDLQIYHDSSNSYITDSGSGNLLIGSDNDLWITNAAGTENKARFTTNGGVNLYYDNSKKFETTTTGIEVSGDISIADKIIHTGDTDTAIRFPADDTVTIETAGSERVRIDSSGNVGIGTDNPTNMLDIAGSTPIIELNDTDTGVIHRINANSATGILYFDSDVNNVGSDGSTIFRHGGDVVLSISGAGTITLGSNSGTIRRSGDIDTYINFDGSDDIRFVAGNVERLEVNTSGIEVNGDISIADKIIHTGDTNTAIRFPAADTFTVETAGAERLRVDSSGNVGIGTDSPAVALDVRNSSPVLRLYDTDATNAYTNITNLNGNMYLGARDDSSNGVLLFGGYGGGAFTEFFRSSSTTFTIDTNQQERMRINSSGNVGIGTDSPQSKLHLADTSTIITFEDTNSTNNSTNTIQNYEGTMILHVDPNDNSTNAESLRFSLRGSEAMRIDSSGNVGIGTNDPQQKLHLKGTIQVDGTTNAINGNYSRIYQNSSGSVDYGLQLKHYQGDTNDEDAAIIIGGNGSSREGNIVFYRDVSGTLTESARIDESGNFGIGTNNPAHSLTLDGANPQLGIADGLGNYSTIGVSKGGAGQGNLIISTSADTDSLIFRRGATETMRINSGGLVGIGTDNPGSLVHALGSYGTIRVENSNTDQYAASGVELKGPAGDERSTKIIHGNSNTGGTETYFQIEQYNAAGSYVKTLSQYSYEFDYWSFSTGGTQRLQITSDGSTYTGGSTITESDMNWTHNTYQRPHIFTGATGGNPSDGAIVVASPETEPSATRVGSVIFGCKTSSTTGVINSGLKAAIDSNTNTNVSDAWKTGGDLRFKTRPDNGDLTERMRIHSNGCITKPSHPLLKINSTSTYGAYQSLHVSPAVSIAQATAQIDVGDNGWTTTGSNAYTFVCPVDGVYAVHAHISLGDITQGDRVIWSMGYSFGGGNLPLSNYVEVIDTNVYDYQNASYFDTWYFSAGTRVGMGINSSTGGTAAGLALSWGMYLLQ